MSGSHEFDEEGWFSDISRRPQDDLAAYTDFLKERVREAFEAVTGPFDDPEATIFLAGPDGFALSPVGHIMQSNESKDIFGNLIFPNMIEEFKAVMWGFMSSTWSIEIEASDEAQEAFHKWQEEHPDASLSEYGDHVEDVILLTGAHDGQFEWWKCRITRDDANGMAPPLFGPWQLVFRMDWHAHGSSVPGRMVTQPMAAVTGRTIIDEEAVDAMTGAALRSHDFLMWMAETWAEQGWTFEEMMDLLGNAKDGDEEAQAEANRRLEVMQEVMSRPENETHRRNLAAVMEEARPEVGIRRNSTLIPLKNREEAERFFDLIGLPEEEREEILGRFPDEGGEE